MTQAPRDPRIYFAAERTFLAWIRTGLALMGFGFVVARFGLFLREIGSLASHTPAATPQFSLWTGTALVLAGVIVNAVSTLQYVRLVRDLNAQRDVTGKPSAIAVALGLLLAVVGLTMSIYLVFVR